MEVVLSGTNCYHFTNRIGDTLNKKQLIKNRTCASLIKKSEVTSEEREIFPPQSKWTTNTYFLYSNTKFCSVQNINLATPLTMRCKIEYQPWNRKYPIYKSCLNTIKNPMDFETEIMTNPVKSSMKSLCNIFSTIIFTTRRRSFSFIKQLLLLITGLLMILPVTSKGFDDDLLNSNYLGGFSRLGDANIFLQVNHTVVKAQAGATAALHCALSAPLADGLVSWVRRNDYHLLTVGRQVYSSDQRIGVKVSPDGSDWILTIRWVTPNDGGEYECQVSSHPPQALMANLSVVEAHAEILGASERYIHAGSSLRLVCLLREATEPPVYVFWYRGDRMINYDTEQGVTVDNSREASVLYINSVSSEHEGNYTCLPSNASPASVTVHVVKRENPAGLQQETNTEKESNPSSSKSGIASSSSSTSTSSVSVMSKSTSSLSSSCLRTQNGVILNVVVFLGSFLFNEYRKHCFDR